MITFKTELEGLIPTYGDLIAIAHDLPSWGQGGEVIAVSDMRLTLSEPLVWSEGEAHYIALRNKTGGVSGAYQVVRGNSDNEVVLQAAPDITICTGTSSERTHFAFGMSDKWSCLAKVLSIKPRGEQVEITAVAEDTRVYQS